MRILEDSGIEFQALPAIYQIETTSVCDLACPMCPRTTIVQRESRMVDPDMIHRMHERGEFAGTTFIELQQSGEPTLHPKLGEIIQFLRDEVGLMVGMSTHGLRLGRAHVYDAVLNLNTLTISVDSTDEAIYHKMRYPAHFIDLLFNLRIFFAEYEFRRRKGIRLPFVELQLVNTPLVAGSGDVAALKALVEREGWQDMCSIRTTKDGWLELDGRQIQGTMPRPGNGQMCMNPFSSVSVNQRGDVVSCCMIFDPHKNESSYYGNLNEQTLEEIWNGPRVKAMRDEHRRGALTGYCAKCYAWSPVNIHRNIIKGLVTINGTV